MRPVFAAARAAVSRRRLQTLIVTMVVLLSAATCVLALGLLVVSRAPFDAAFARAHGAHVSATLLSGKSTSALAATRTAAGVTAAAGPFDLVTASMTWSGSGSDGSPGRAAGQPGIMTTRLPSATVAGRSVQGGSVDRLSLDSGHWLTGPGQIVLSRAFSVPHTSGTATVTLDLPGSPKLTVVGIAASVTGSADAWVWPTQSNVLHAAGAPAARQMLYRFSSHRSAAALTSSFAGATATLPKGTVTGTSTYLAARRQSNRSIQAFVPFVVAFAVLGVVLSILITTNVVNGAVVSGYRVIGVLKSVGFTPGQVVGVYTLQVLIPAIAGCVVGVPLGLLLTLPLLDTTDRAYDLPSSRTGIPLWIMIAVLIGAPLLVALSAVGPALRAGRLAPMQALSVGRAPRTGRGYRLRRMLTATAMPRSVALGLGMPLARPSRAAGTVIAIMLGVVTLVFAIGLMTSLSRVHGAFSRAGAVPILVHTGGPQGPPQQDAGPGADPGTGPAGGPATWTSTPPDLASLQASIAKVTGTAHSVPVSHVPLHVEGFTPSVTGQAYAGDARWAGYAMISGHWYTGADQIVASSYLLHQSGYRVGDRLTLVGNKGRRTVTVAGEFLSGDDSFELLTSTAALTGVGTTEEPPDIEIGLRPGTSPSSYAQALERQLGSNSGAFVENHADNNDSRTFVILDSLITTLTLLLGSVAALGVLNTVLLNTRERIHDIGVLKSLGMTPRQVRTMVITSMIGLGALAGAVAVPCGAALHRHILTSMGRAISSGLPASILDVYTASELLLLGAAGIALAIVGALLPAGWAARTRAATALRAE